MATTTMATAASTMTATTVTAPSQCYPPDPRLLLPPLLACLPTSAFSSKAPPALPPLLTPILRQRLAIFEKSPQAESWLRLLNWKTQQAAKLPGLVESMNLEAHPVSGEPEIRDVAGIHYKRYDSETLHARLQVDEFGLEPVYLWCIAGCEQGAGWLLTELKPLEDEDSSESWYDSIIEAEDAFRALQSAKAAKEDPFILVTAAQDDDSAYWAAYDMDPGRTPGISNKPSPAPGAAKSTGPGRTAESAYFERYASEVQPAMDPYDATEDDGNMPESTLNHHQRELSGATDGSAFSLLNGFANDASATNGGPGLVIDISNTPPQHHNPNPRSSAQSSPRSIRALEAEAERQSLAEVGIKQHISTDFKSLFRLARSAGISREEFESMIRRELDVLPLLDSE